MSNGAVAYRHASCLQLSHRRPLDMCGLWTRPRTDVDPPRFLPPSNCHWGAYRFAASGAIACYLRVFMWLAETRGLKDARQVENLQDQAQVMLGQHTRAQYPNQPVRSAATNTSFLRQFLPRDAMHPRYQPWACVCLCPSVSVRLSQVGVLLKRQNLGSHKQHHTIPQGL